MEARGSSQEERSLGRRGGSGPRVDLSPRVVPRFFQVIPETGTEYSLVSAQHQGPYLPKGLTLFQACVHSRTHPEHYEEATLGGYQGWLEAGGGTSIWTA